MSPTRKTLAILLPLFLLFLSLPPVAARQAAHPVAEMVGKRTETSRTVQNDDGSYTLQAYTHPIHYRAADGTWKPYDLILKRSQRSGFAWASEGNSLRTYLPDHSDGAVRAESGQNAVTFQPLGTSGGAATAVGNRLFVRNAWTHTTLSYYAGFGKLKEQMTLTASDAPSSFSFALSTEGLTPSLNDDNTVSLLKSTGERAMVIPAPWMADAAGVVTTSIAVSLAQTDQGWTYTMTPSADWLGTAQYPVVIDPTLSVTTSYTQEEAVSFHAGTFWSGITADGNASDTRYLAVGERSPIVAGDPTRRYRAVLNFSPLGLPVNANVTSASLNMTMNPNGDMDDGVQVDSHEQSTVIEAWDLPSSATTWTAVDNAWNTSSSTRVSSVSSPQLTLNGSDYVPYQILGGTDYSVARFVLNVKDIVQLWRNTNQTMERILLRETSDGNTSTVHNMLRFAPDATALAVNYTLATGTLSMIALSQVYGSAPPTGYGSRLTGTLVVQNAGGTTGGTGGTITLTTSNATLAYLPATALTVPAHNASGGDATVTFPIYVQSFTATSTPIGIQATQTGTSNTQTATLTIAPKTLPIKNIYVNDSQTPAPPKPTIGIDAGAYGIVTLKRDTTQVTAAKDSNNVINDDGIDFLTGLTAGSTSGPTYTYEALVTEDSSPSYTLRNVQVVPVKILSSDDQTVDSRLTDPLNTTSFLDQDFGTATYNGGLFVGLAHYPQADVVTDPVTSEVTLLSSVFRLNATPDPATVDSSKIARSFIKFASLPTLSTGQAWATGSVVAYFKQLHYSTTAPMSICCVPISEDSWYGETGPATGLTRLKWSSSATYPDAPTSGSDPLSNHAAVSPFIHWLPVQVPPVPDTPATLSQWLSWPLAQTLTTPAYIGTTDRTLSVVLYSKNEVNSGWAYLAKKSYMTGACAPYLVCAYTK